MLLVLPLRFHGERVDPWRDCHYDTMSRNQLGAPFDDGTPPWRQRRGPNHDHEHATRTTHHALSPARAGEMPANFLAAHFGSSTALGFREWWVLGVWLPALTPSLVPQ